MIEVAAERVNLLPAMAATSSRTRLAVCVVALAVAAVVLMFGAGSVAAHSDLESSSPAEGETVSEPVDEIEVAFTSTVETAGAGFEVLDPQGEIREPEVEMLDDRTFLLRLDPPLAGGTVGVRYAVKATDGHTMTGGFAFEVDAPVPTTTTTTTTTVPTTTASTPATSETVPTTTASTPATSTTAPTTTAPPEGPEDTADEAATTTAPTTSLPSDDEPDRIEPAVIGALALAVAGGVGGGWAVRRNGSRPA